jgi:ABC-2 type transport system ATP-binding protein
MIQVEGLTKYYGENAAIRDLSFVIETGEVVGFLGLNGAGKSTTLKILGCVLQATSGRVVIDGFDVTLNPHEIRRRIGFLPDTPPLYDEMTVEGFLAFVAQLRGLSSSVVAPHVEEAMRKTALLERRDTLIGELSHGFRQRVGLAQAIVHKPKLLILDEPTGGLDPVQTQEMRGLIRELRGEHTVLLSSHLLTEISQICDRYLVIQAGALTAQGTEAELSQQLGTAVHLEVDLRGDAARAAAALTTLPKVGHVEHSTTEAGLVTLRLTCETDVRPDVVRLLVAQSLDVLRVDRTATRLENIFLELTQKKAAKT